MIFLILLFLLLPSQLAFHLWPSWSLINGIRVDYLSPTLYLTDILIFLLMALKGSRIKVQGSIILFVVLNTFFSVNPLISLYRWVRVYEYFWLFKYLISQKDRLLNLVPWALNLTVLWTAILAWWQFFLQRSVGDFWYWLGERPLSVGTPGIAKISVNWILDIGYWTTGLIMRPYATFPHPNALAGFLLVAGLIILSITPRPPLPAKLSHLRGGVRRTRVIYWLALFAAFLTIPITFSRTAIVLEILILLIYLRPLIFKIILLVSGLYFLISITGSSVSLPDRISLNHLAILTIKQFPLLGVGLGNFIPASGLYQPVHNIYLLLASELGLPALVVISYWLMVHGKKLLKTMNHELITTAAVIAITGAADHYWLTLHQNILLLVVLLAIIKVKSTNYEL